MLRPLHTVIRNLTDRTLIINTTPMLYVYAHAEQDLDYDLFTRSQNSTAALETLLIAVRKGEAQIVYKVDPKYATVAAGGDYVRLSMQAERRIGSTPVNAVEHKPVVAEGLRTAPFGKTLDEVAEGNTATAEVKHNVANDVDMVSEKLDPAVKSPTVTLSKEAAEAVDKTVDLSPAAATEPATETAEETVTTPTTKKTRSKKAVTTL